ncbi:hypothetical protein [Rossellomorea marisflavi]|uniref:hypothetical protein n=1 Tax=Rossellomorea marisflavi TaxID=189381 RepID=UPI003F9F7B59
MNDPRNNPIDNLYLQNEFLDQDSQSFNPEFKSILGAINKDDFIEECELNPVVSYNEAVKLACRRATMYLLFAVANHPKLGAPYLQSLNVVDGWVGHIPHTWLMYNNQFFVDMTLAQFTDAPIPETAILPIEKAGNVYTVQYVLTWKQWVDLESQQKH